jgi:hypothetical protein
MVQSNERTNTNNIFAAIRAAYLFESLFFSFRACARSPKDRSIHENLEEMRSLFSLSLYSIADMDERGTLPVQQVKPVSNIHNTLLPQYSSNQTPLSLLSVSLSAVV